VRAPLNVHDNAVEELERLPHERVGADDLVFVG
jgi:hypothetical protein